MARDTLVDRFLQRGRDQGPQPALWYKDGNTWKHYTWEQYVARARQFAAALLKLGLAPGEGVAIMSYNNPEWVIADVGTMMARGVPAGIYQTCTQEQALYIANHCKARVLILEDEALWKQLDGAAFKKQLQHTDQIVLIRGADKIADPEVISFEEFLATGAGSEAALDAAIAALEENELGTLIYTSGTTGPPKGVMLSHKNMAWTSKAAIDLVGGAGPDDTIVSYLPLSHIAEQMFSIHLPLSSGVPIWFAEDLTKLKDCLVLARPTLFLAVPRVWEKFRNALEAKLADATGIKEKIVSMSRDTLLEAGHISIKKGEDAFPPMLKAKHALANKLFASKLKAALGLDRLKVAVTGAAPISYDVLEFFLSIGITIHEVYGQSEGSGPTTFNYPIPGKRKLGSAGMPFPGVEVKIADDGEILVRGPNVFMGYYRDEDATAETLVDGWLHSGDIGRFDEDGFLYITDRKKDLIITAGGKNVAPQNIEKMIREIEGVGNAVVIGDRRKFLTALVTVDPEQGPALATKRGWPTEPGALAEHAAFVAYIEEQLEKGVNEELARYETIKKFAILPLDFTVEGGELTPTQKVKRRVVNEKYGDKIEEFYAGLE